MDDPMVFGRRTFSVRWWIFLATIYIFLTTIGMVFVGHKAVHRERYSTPVLDRSEPVREKITQRFEPVTSTKKIIPKTKKTPTSGRDFSQTRKKFSEHANYVVTRQTCPENPSGLKGRIEVNITEALRIFKSASSVTNHDKERFEKDAKFLGTPIDWTNDTDSLCQKKLTTIYEPENCEATHSVAMIIPCRDREEHLKIILGHLHPLLRKHLLRYAIFVITQVGNDTFNKARLLNTGFEFASRIGRATGRPFDCFIFQDIDLLPENDMNIYKCPQESNEIYHFSTAISTFNYEYMPAAITVGGVVGMREDQFRKVNGYSNEYWGWGGEDDDLNLRIAEANLNISRPTEEVGRYTMLKHERDVRNLSEEKKVFEILDKAPERYHTDGLSNLNTRITSVTWMPLYTYVSVDVGKPPLNATGKG